VTLDERTLGTCSDCMSNSQSQPRAWVREMLVRRDIAIWAPPGGNRVHADSLCNYCGS